MPFLSIFLKNANQNILKLFIMMSICLNAISCIGVSEEGNHYYHIYLFGTRYILFIVAGYYLGNYELSLLNRRRLYILGVISSFIILFGIAFAQMYNMDYYFFLKYPNIPCTLTAFAVFIAFRNTKWEYVLSKLNMKEEKLRQLSSYSLGIYLFQFFGIGLLSKIKLIDDNLLLKFVIMYLISIVVIMTLKQIPYVNKIV